MEQNDADLSFGWRKRPHESTPTDNRMKVRVIQTETVSFGIIFLRQHL
jgi:hypothetical protein